MNQVIEMIRAGATIQKGLFLMLCGILFVFSVQLIFYLVIKLWPRHKGE
ncbi:hypothetical protein LJC14_03210 [Treponema sp. OttesenSCG-928-L16]|nr:hypothetical protein [Treponema sp. OttesenSCG-928-L16]